MKSLLKLAALVAFAVFIKTHFMDAGTDLRKLDLLPVDVRMVQGERPSTDAPIFIGFWDTKSSRSAECLRYMNELQGRYGSRGLAVIGITSESEDTALSYANRAGVTYAFAVDPAQRYANALRIYSLPQAVLVNRAGKVVWKGFPNYIPDSKLESVVNPQS